MTAHPFEIEQRKHDAGHCGWCDSEWRATRFFHDGKWYHSLPEPAGQIVCGRQEPMELSRSLDMEGQAC